MHVAIQPWPEASPVVPNDGGQRTPGLELASRHGENGSPIVVVASVDPNGTAADSAIQKGDIIVRAQQTPVSEPDEGLRIFWIQSSLQRRFAAVLIERDKKLSWRSPAVPE
jgi:hypothetical protein